MTTQQALNLGFQKLNSGDLLGAGQLFESVLTREPVNFVAINGRAFIALQQNRLPQSLADFQQSLAINAKQPFARKMEAIVLGAMGQFDRAMQSFSLAIQLDRKDPEIFFNRANFRFQAGFVKEALEDLDAAIKLKPSYLEARSNRANLLMQVGDFARAVKDLDYLVTKAANNPDIWVALGLVRYKLGMLRESIQCNERALKIVPDHPDALLNNASAAFDQKDYEAALGWITKALAATPNRAEVYYTKANVLAAMSSFELAIADYDQALLLNPNYAEGYNARGLAKANLRLIDAAEADYDRAIALRPDFDDAIYNKSYAQLEHGDFERAWQGYEKRFNVPSLEIRRVPNLPVWTGETLAGALLARGEQGLGDQILFSSMLPDLVRLPFKVCVQVAPRLVPLFQRSFPTLDIGSDLDPVPVGTVAQISLGSLGQFFRNSLDSFKTAPHPYLFADPVKTAAYRALLAPQSEKLVGVSWKSFAKRFTSHKSIALMDLLPIAQTERCKLVNLQYGDVAEEIAAAKPGGIVFDESVDVDLTQDIDGLASLISACDVIVTVSNTTAHIAGALGKPVLLMLPYRIGKLWYWSEAQGGHSLWYPTVTAFHQTQPDSWASTINAVKETLISKA